MFRGIKFGANAAKQDKLDKKAKKKEEKKRKKKEKKERKKDKYNNYSSRHDKKKKKRAQSSSSSEQESSSDDAEASDEQEYRGKAGRREQHRDPEIERALRAGERSSDDEEGDHPGDERRAREDRDSSRVSRAARNYHEEEEDRQENINVATSSAATSKDTAGGKENGASTNKEKESAPPRSGGGLDLFSAFGAGITDFESRDDRKKRERAEQKAAEAGANGRRLLDDPVAHERELNPAAYEKSAQGMTTGGNNEGQQSKPGGGWSLPAHLRVGDGGKGWQNRAGKRGKEEQQDPELFKKALPVKRTGGKKGKKGGSGADLVDGLNADGLIDPDEDLSRYEWGGRSNNRGGGGGNKSRGKRGKQLSSLKSDEAVMNAASTASHSFASGAFSGSRNGGSSRNEYDDSDIMGGAGAVPGASFGASRRLMPTSSARHGDSEDDEDGGFAALRQKYQDGDGTRGKGSGEGNARSRRNEQRGGSSSSSGPSGRRYDDDQHRSGGHDTTTSSTSTGKGNSATNEANLDRNVLQAKALEAMMNGDDAEYTRLTALLQEAKPMIESTDKNADNNKGKDHVKGGKKGTSRKGKGDSKGENGKDDEASSVTDMLRREKMGGEDNHERMFVDHIRKRGRNFMDVGGHDYEEDGSWNDNFVEKKRKRGQPPPEQKGGKGGKNGSAGNSLMSRDRLLHLQRCHHCYESSRWSYEKLLIAQSDLAYLAFENSKVSFLENEMIIAPWDHVNSLSLNDMDEDSYQEMRNYMKALVAFFNWRNDQKRNEGDQEEFQSLTPLFIETLMEVPSPDRQSLGGSAHCVVRVLPVPSDAIGELQIYFREAFREAVGEFDRTHKALVEIRNGNLRSGVVVSASGRGGSASASSAGGNSSTAGLLGLGSMSRAAVAKRFPYVFVDFGMEKGYVHPVDEKLNKDFVKHVLCGCLDIDFLTHKAYPGGEKQLAQAMASFKKDFEESGCDWTQQVNRDGAVEVEEK
ncbi:unnamed protein product [Amoebophrya sp. A25]|nr:unnamed protein product [Amoebophrya sp. A25]|eukprot:GSA25T00021925001.1